MFQVDATEVNGDGGFVCFRGSVAHKVFQSVAEIVLVLQRVRPPVLYGVVQGVVGICQMNSLQ